MLDGTLQTHPPHVVELLPCPSAAGGRRLRQTKRTPAYALDEHLDVVVCRIRPGNSDELAPSSIVESGNVLLGSVLEV